MKAVIKGSAFLGFVFVVFSMGCADAHKNANTQSGAVPPSSEATPQTTGFVGPDLTTFKDAQGTTAGTASQEATDGVPGTPLQSRLSEQIKKPNMKLVISDDDLSLLPPEIKSGLHLEQIRIQIFNEINKERTQAGVKPVKYDRTGELAAGIHVLEQLDAKNWLSHYSLDGDLPYMRYSRAGGYDSVSENAAVWSGSADFGASLNQKNPCTTAQELPPASADSIDGITLYSSLYLECLMVSEKAPNDGHRKTILDPNATAVGISVGVGIWEDETNGHKANRITLFMVEEFETRGLVGASQLPLSVQSSEKKSMTFSGQMDPSFDFDHGRLFFETLKTKTVEEAQKLNHYSLPDHYKLLLPSPPAGEKWDFPPQPDGKKMDFADNITVQKDKFSIPIPLDQGPGVYTLLVVGKRKSDGSMVGASMRSIYVNP